ncbi:release factor glutamine methyltransferase [Marinospirillum celere]|uniref:Release factor glutamine methyltransferase n=1 Tax=Marinospirillum celere TaxID=1122252 RepID=A0A1I1FWM8_9GAMM|nr:peptide chain release factor N(5)-glutamine methyltransferase [Marinospirillum celere]SFC03432.1 release factor glutamine methyltransferase [Marinospirillum celere]
MAVTLKSWLLEASRQLQEAGQENARQEAEMLLCQQLQKNTAYLFAWPELTLTPIQQEQLASWLQQRLDGRPLAWILGAWEFWGLRLEVSPATLIPRADTECLVEQALSLGEAPALRVMDLGTGTGALALALKKERPGWQVEAVDFQPAAVTLARKNARQLELDVRIWQSDWWQSVPPGDYDLILSNPPYIHPDDPHLLQGDVRFEPQTALVGGDDGLEAYRKLLSGIEQRLKPGGWLLVEQGYDQAEAVAELFARAGLVEISGFQDYAGQPRITQGRRPKV